MRQTTKRTVAKARLLRREMTPPEASLWQILRSRPNGLKFRRQHPAGPFILDFYCPAAKLAIEIDGIVHGMGDHPARDAERDHWLSEQGYRVLRVSADEVKANIEGVVQRVISACTE